MARLSARIRLPLQYAAFVAIVVGVLLLLGNLAGLVPDGVWGLFFLAGGALFVVSFLLTLLGPAAQAPTLELAPPVRGRWLALNSPTTKTPSHGTHGYGQTWAIDLVHTPDDRERPEFGRTDAALMPPEAFPAFGQPVLAPADASVVRAKDGQRDHRSRSSWGALALFFAESAPRELRGPAGLLGNHVVLRLADGSHFVLAHLRRGSVRVRVGDTVVVGQPVAEVGNTGNSTEPHLHCHRQDVASSFVAMGLPWTVPGGLPANEETRDF